MCNMFPMLLVSKYQFFKIEATFEKAGVQYRLVDTPLHCNAMALPAASSLPTGAGGATAPPIFSRSVNPIDQGRADYS